MPIDVVICVSAHVSGDRFWDHAMMDASGLPVYFPMIFSQSRVRNVQVAIID
jgi:hypothetical protein